MPRGRAFRANDADAGDRGAKKTSEPRGARRPPTRPSPTRRAAAGGPKPRGVRPPRSAGSNPVAVPSDRGSLVRKPQVSPAADAEVSDHDDTIRLQKFLAAAGVDSRRNCETYIREGRVTVDSAVITDPAHGINPDVQDIRLDGERLRQPRYRYYLLNKPRGVLCTNSDPEGRIRAIDLIPSKGMRLFSVGRLDESTVGLLLITNDGDLAQRLAHPRFEVVRRYRCQVAGVPNDEVIQQLRDGMYFSDGFFRFRSVRFVKRLGKSAILELELREGKNREIRRLLAKVGHKVIALERIAFGPLRLGSLPSGKHRELGTREVFELRKSLEQLERGEGDGISERRPADRAAKTRVTERSRRPAKRTSNRRSPGSPAAGSSSAARDPNRSKGRDRRRK